LSHQALPFSFVNLSQKLLQQLLQLLRQLLITGRCALNGALVCLCLLLHLALVTGVTLW
jgi:hypothetical protein